MYCSSPYPSAGRTQIAGRMGGLPRLGLTCSREQRVHLGSQRLTDQPRRSSPWKQRSRGAGRLGQNPGLRQPNKAFQVSRIPRIQDPPGALGPLVCPTGAAPQRGGLFQPLCQPARQLSLWDRLRARNCLSGEAL